MAKQRWVRRRSAGARAARRTEARAKAERVYEAEARWRPGTARASAEDTYKRELQMSRAIDRSARHLVRRKTDPSWDLRKANVGRDKRTGRFVKRTVRTKSP